ncbi:hypothetical protein H312_01409, partial [Anncaliia algerae PRA339]
VLINVSEPIKNNKHLNVRGSHVGQKLVQLKIPFLKSFNVKINKFLKVVYHWSLGKPLENIYENFKMTTSSLSRFFKRLNNTLEINYHKSLPKLGEKRSILKW